MINKILRLSFNYFTSINLKGIGRWWCVYVCECGRGGGGVKINIYYISNTLSLPLYHWKYPSIYHLQYHQQHFELVGAYRGL